MNTTPLVESFSGRTKVSDQTSFLVTKERRLTYGEVEDHNKRFVSMLAAEGIPVGSNIAVVSHDPVAVGQLSLAVIASGCTLCVVDPEATPREIRAALVVATPKMVFAAGADAERMGLAEDCVWSFVEIEAAPAVRSIKSRLLGKKANDDQTMWPGRVHAYEPALDRPELDPESTAVLVFTSGSTSRPKGVELSVRAIHVHLETLEREFGFSEGVIHNVLPLSHVDGLICGPLLTYFAGATWVRPVPFTLAAIPELLDSVYRERVTHMFVVPTMLALYARLASDMDDAFTTDDFRMVISSAGQLGADLWQRFEANFSTYVCNSYGLSETVTSSLASGPAGSATRRVGTIGKPLDCVVELRDDDDNPVAPGEIGEIVITGDHIFSRYRGDTEATETVLSGRTFHTGDLAVMDPDGFYQVKGRKGSKIIRGGRNISAVEVNDAVARCKGVVQCATVGIDDDVWGQRVETAVVADGLSAEQILEQLRDELSAYKVPQRVVVVDELPLTRSGKINDKEVVRLLAEPDQAMHAQAGISESVLALAAVAFGAGQHELTLASQVGEAPGWDSLAHLDLVGMLEDRFNFVMTNTDILGITSLADAVAVVQSASPE